MGFYAKFFILSDLINIEPIFALIVILCSIISCVKYLNIIQLSNFNINNNNKMIKIEINPILSFFISILTLLILFSILKPIYLISLISYL
jgi:NADH:ubiquinone oxidoreductase subunit 4 (subunit M)